MYMFVSQENLKIMAHFYFKKKLRQCTETVNNKCPWLQMTRMEMNHNFENLGLTFSSCFPRVVKKSIFIALVCFLFGNYVISPF